MELTYQRNRFYSNNTTAHYLFKYLSRNYNYSSKLDLSTVVLKTKVGNRQTIVAFLPPKNVLFFTYSPYFLFSLHFLM